ncbi:MAG: LuxR C-terminal-related transcriptional regulator [Parasphingorhabdus sp.]
MPQGVKAEIQTPIPWFSRSKTRAPKFSIPLVERKRLLLALDAALDKPISCIVAPAGFGKSTLLSQWRESLIEQDIPCAWINLDENDSEIRQFFAYLVFAFEDAGVSLGYLKEAAESGFVDMSSTAITTSLLSAIIDIEDHMVLVLDDYHRVSSDEIDDFVKILSDQCGDKVHIAIGSRTVVNTNLPTLLAAGQAIEIPSVQLRFSDREVLEAMGENLDEADVAALQKQVEGWPVAVQMTRLFSGTNKRHLVSPKGIASPHGHLADYLVTNVLENQSQELQEFLLKTSILNSFNADLANAVCGHSNSQSLIHQLDSLQALVVPLDDDLEWFRYHHLFSECVRDFLMHKNSGLFNELHRRAAGWCSENQMIAEAVNYANAIGDYELSRQIIKDNCAWIRARRFGGTGYFNGLLANIPEEEIVHDPRILFSKAYACMLAGRHKNAFRYQNIAETLIDRDGITPELLQDRLHVGTLIIARAETASDRDGVWLKERLEQATALTETHPEARFLCAVIGNTLGLSSLSFGDFDIAQEQMTAAYQHCKGTISVTTAYTQIGFGSIALWTNRLGEARRYFEQAADTVIQFASGQSNLRFICETLLQTINYWQSGIEDAVFHELENVLLNMVEGDAYADIYCTGFDAIIHSKNCSSDFDQAEQLLRKLENCNDRIGNERIAKFVQLLRLNCAVARGNHCEAGPMFEKVRGWFDADPETLEKLGWFHRSAAGYSCARYLLAMGQYKEALRHVKRGLKDIDPLDVVLIRVRGCILEASILEKAGNNDQALVVLEGAIVDAARINCARAFAADVPEALLSVAVISILRKTKSNAVKEFAGRLAVSGAQKLLSSREEEVLWGIAQGKSNKEIARELDLTDNTIKFHLRNIYRKLEVKKRVPAVEKARELGLLS